MPFKVVKTEITMERNITEEAETSNLMRIKALYDAVEKFSLASLVIAHKIRCALTCVPMNTPVVFTFRGRVQRTFSFAQFKKSVMDNKDILSNFYWSYVSSSPNQSILMRLRATTWNAIRNQKKLHKAALKFGVIPLHLYPNYEQRSRRLFHVIFNTSSNNSVSIFTGNNGEAVIRTFAWRHWRFIEAIFHHYPFSGVIMHSNSLTQSQFDVLTEVGCELLVKS